MSLVFSTLLDIIFVIRCQRQSCLSRRSTTGRCCRFCCDVYEMRQNNILKPHTNYEDLNMCIESNNACTATAYCGYAVIKTHFKIRNQILKQACFLLRINLPGSRNILVVVMTSLFTLIKLYNVVLRLGSLCLRVHCRVS